MLPAAQLLLGAAACAAFIFAARTPARRGELFAYAAGLFVAALIYVAFAAYLIPLSRRAATLANAR